MLGGSSALSSGMSRAIVILYSVSEISRRVKRGLGQTHAGTAVGVGR